MWLYLLYFIVIFFANTVGSISGMGGGVLIKPLLDSIGYHSLAEIGFYSCVAVFTMSITSTYKQIKNGIVINWQKACILSVGSLLGGMLGERIFHFLLQQLPNESGVQLIQIFLTIVSLVFVLFYTKYQQYSWKISKKSLYVLVGFFLGTFSTLLGIGGGPINVSLLILCFGIPMKEATVYSIITIFFSQLAKLFSIGFSTGFGVFDLAILLAVIPAALIGGYSGGWLSGKMKEATVSRLFSYVVWGVILLNILNGVRIFI